MEWQHIHVSYFLNNNNKLSEKDTSANCQNTKTRISYEECLETRFNSPAKIQGTEVHSNIGEDIT